MSTGFIWTDGIENALNEIRHNSLSLSDSHKNNYYKLAIARIELTPLNYELNILPIKLYRFQFI